MRREVPPIGGLLTDDDTITFGTHRLTILPTPGHTPGSVTFYCEEETWPSPATPCSA